MSFQKPSTKKVLLTILWIGIGVCTVLLSVAAMKRQSGLLCKGVKVDIKGVDKNPFIDEKDVKKIIVDFTGKKPEGTPVDNFNLKAIEAAIEKDVWVDNAELFFDRNSMLQVNVNEREPVARVFTKSGNTFYIDSSVTMLPLSDKFSARLPVFTGFTTDAKVLLPADSALLFDIKKISIAIQKDNFLMAMIDQVDITPERNFEMTPKIGDQQIIFGDASDIDQKFNKLKLFYKDVITRSGWSHYSTINLQYKDEIVAKVRGKQDVIQDSLRTLQLMDYMAKNAAIESADSMKVAASGNDNTAVDATLIQQSVERDDEGMDRNTEDDATNPALDPTLNTAVKPIATPATPPPVKPVAPKPVVVKPIIKPAAKPTDKKPVTKPAADKPKPVAKPAAKPTEKKPVQKPKVVMPKNDY
jgi:cell division protein FtsQ